MGRQFTLSKKDRIRSTKIFDLLFEKGSSIYVYPLKLIFVTLPESFDQRLLFGVSVPKKIHRKAVKRNLLKRRVREVFRKSKPFFEMRLHQERPYALLYLYLSKEVEDSKTIRSAVKRINKKFLKINHA